MEVINSTPTNARWDGASARGIVRRIVAMGTLQFEEAVRLASGEAATVVDEVLLRDAFEGKALLPGTTLAGALRAVLERRMSDAALARKLFGGVERVRGEEIMLESLVVVDDALGESAEVELRDGVKLEGATRTAKDGALYDAESWAPGLSFNVRVELAVPASRGDQEEQLIAAFATMLDHLADEGITFGARKRRGFGLARVDTWHIRSFDLTTVDDLIAWIDGPDKAAKPVPSVCTALGVEPLPDNRAMVDLEAEFSIDSSLLIRSYASGDGKDPDMTHLRSGGKPILSGTTIAGGLRAQAARILSVIAADGDKSASTFIEDLFGPDLHDRSDKSEPTWASRLDVRTSIIENATTDLVQHRVSIDRFTGGAFPGALFNQQPVMATPETTVTIRLRIHKPNDADIGLVLLLLKDLWTGYLPLGGERSVGRGRLAGRHATLTIRENGVPTALSIAASDGGLDIGHADRDRLEKYVAALHSKFQG